MESWITIDLQFEDNAAVCVVLASDGYPVSYRERVSDHRTGKLRGKRRLFLFPCRNQVQ